MSETQSSDQSSSGTESLVMPETPLDRDYDDMTASHLRGSIAVEVGKNTNWDTHLTKDTLNSVYAALTGEYAVPKRDLHRPNSPEFRDRRTILRMVVVEAGIGSPEDEWSVPEDEPSHLRRDELQTLREEMADRGNQMLEDGDGE